MTVKSVYSHLAAADDASCDDFTLGQIALYKENADKLTEALGYKPLYHDDVLHSCRLQPSLKKLVKGLMIESYLEDGCQKVEDGIYGKSITDPCLGWEKTENLILDLANQL